MALNKQQLLEEVILKALGGSGRGQMGNAPKQHNIRGEPHYLNYATAEEMKHLKDDGGTGEMTKYNIPAFPKGGDDDESKESSSFGGTGQTGGYDESKDQESLGPDSSEQTGGSNSVNEGGIDVGGSEISNDGPSQREGESDADFKNRENPMFSNAELAAMRANNEPIPDPDPDPDPEPGGDTPPPPPPPPQYPDWEGVMHDSPEGAATRNEELLATGKAGAIEGAEGFEHDLSGGYKSAYEQQLSDAYDAAYAGVGQDILNTGTGDYQALEDAVSGQDTYLTELSTNYQANAQNTYDDWYGTNTDAINALTNLKDIEDYVWTDMPEYDLDNTGGLAPNGTFDGDFMPEFYGDFNKVYAKDYKNPSGWQYDADGNPIPGSFGPTEGISSGGAPPDPIEEPVSTPEQEAEGLGYTNPYEAPTGVQQYSPAKGSASYRR
jgi:hypothetical protein